MTEAQELRIKRAAQELADALNDAGGEVEVGHNMQGKHFIGSPSYFVHRISVRFSTTREFS